MTLAEEHERGVEYMLEYFREMLIIALQTMTEGMPAIHRREARTIIKFWETETDQGIWAKLAQIPDPDQPNQSIAASWLAQWQRLGAAVGDKNAIAG